MPSFDRFGIDPHANMAFQLAVDRVNDERPKALRFLRDAAHYDHGLAQGIIGMAYAARTDRTRQARMWLGLAATSNPWAKDMSDNIGPTFPAALDRLYDAAAAGDRSAMVLSGVVHGFGPAPDYSRAVKTLWTAAKLNVPYADGVLSAVQEKWARDPDAAPLTSIGGPGPKPQANGNKGPV